MKRKKTSSAVTVVDTIACGISNHPSEGQLALPVAAEHYPTWVQTLFIQLSYIHLV